jgi:mono/diheme cytochrome c family protein
MKKTAYIAFSIAGLVALVASCSDVKRDRGTIYMPDMQDSRAYETYSSSPVFRDGQTNREPVAGTVRRGEAFVFHLPMDKTGDTANYFASRSIRNPLGPLSEAEKKEAERLYLVYCGICHGPKLDGNGPLWKDGDGPYPSKPAALVGEARYEQMPEGQMFYSVTYGKNLMGGYAAQLDAKQRWMVISYVKSKQSGGAPAAAPAPAAADSAVAAK